MRQGLWRRLQDRLRLWWLRWVWMRRMRSWLVGSLRHWVRRRCQMLSILGRLSLLLARLVGRRNSVCEAIDVSPEISAVTMRCWTGCGGRTGADICWGAARAASQAARGQVKPQLLLWTCAFDSDTDHVCGYDGIPMQQARGIVVQYLYSHPEERHERASMLAARALSQAFPCQR